MDEYIRGPTPEQEEGETMEKPVAPDQDKDSEGKPLDDKVPEEKESDEVKGSEEKTDSGSVGMVDAEPSIEMAGDAETEKTAEAGNAVEAGKMVEAEASIKNVGKAAEVEEKAKPEKAAENEASSAKAGKKAETGKNSIVKGYLYLLARVAVIAAVGYLIFSYAFLITQCHGQNMFPAMKDGDLCIVFRSFSMNLMGERLNQDDVVAYTRDGERYFGRVIASAGDTVAFRDGDVIVNGVRESGEILFPTEVRDDGETDGGEVIVPEGCVYILGDYRTNTKDSRDFGPVPLEDLEGKVITILRRRGL